MMCPGPAKLYHYSSGSKILTLGFSWGDTVHCVVRIRTGPAQFAYYLMGHLQEIIIFQYYYHYPVDVLCEAYHPFVLVDPKYCLETLCDKLFGILKTSYCDQRYLPTSLSPWKQLFYPTQKIPMLRFC
jgi:hypothetical protein